MKRFRYKARTTTGEVVKGEVEATSDKIAAKLLKRKGYIIVSIKPKTEFVFDITKKFKDRVTSKDVTNFTRQLQSRDTKTCSQHQIEQVKTLLIWEAQHQTDHTVKSILE